MLRSGRFLLALVLAATPAAAQLAVLPQELRRAPDSAPAPAPLPAPPATIAPIDIPLRAGAAMARIAEISTLMHPRGTVLAIERAATGVVDSVNGLTASQLRLLSSQTTRRALTDLVTEWDRWGILVKGWIRTLRNRAAELDLARHELTDGQELWHRSAARARNEAAPAEVIAEAAQVEERLREQEQAVLARLRQLVQLEVGLTRAGLTIDAGRAAVEEAIERDRRQLFRIDSPSLWTALTSGDLPALGETIRTRWTMALTAVGLFIETNRGRVVGHLLGAILLLLIIMGLRRSTGWPDGEEAKRVSPDEGWLLEHPFASTLLTTFLATAVLYPRAPSAVYDLTLLIAVVPLFRVMPALLTAGLLRFGRRGTLLFLADRITTMLLHTTPWHRVASAAVAIVGVALGIIGLRRYQELDKVTRERPTTRWLARGTLLGSMLFGTALVANLFGNVTLALVLTTGVVTLVYLGVLLYAVAQVLDGVVSVGVRVTSDDLRFVERHGAAISRRVTQLVHVAAFLAWLGFALFLLYLSEPARALLSGILGATWSIGQAKFSLAGVLLFFGTVWIGALVGRWVAIVLEVDILDRLDLPRGVPVTIASIVRYTLTAIAFFLALAAIGADISQLAIIGGALSVGVGFGLQTIVNNFISGLILAFERPLAIGDVIQIGELEGEVRHIGIRASIIRTFQGADVIVPNGQLISQELINWTRSDRTRRLELPVGVAYGTDPNAVVSLLPEIAAAHPRVRTHPAPLCLFQGFGESSLDFVLRVWTDADDFPVVRSEVRLAVHDALKAAGIAIPFPQRDVHVRSLPATPPSTPP